MCFCKFLDITQDDGKELQGKDNACITRNRKQLWPGMRVINRNVQFINLGSNQL